MTEQLAPKPSGWLNPADQLRNTLLEITKLHGKRWRNCRECGMHWPCVTYSLAKKSLDGTV